MLKAQLPRECLFCVIGMAVTIAGAPYAWAKNTLRVPSQHLTIQAAIDAASPGDTVLVADGTYAGAGNRDMDFGGKAITVRSENGPEACIMDVDASAEDRHRAFHFHSGERAESVLEGVTIQNGFMDRGGAVLCESGSAPLFRACVFRQNTAWTDDEEDGGGAVYNLGSSPTFNDCQFVENHVEANFLFMGGGGMQNQAGSNPTLTGCVFRRNNSSGSEQLSAAGGMYCQVDSHAVLDRCTFEENRADWDAGMTCWFTSSATLTDCVFRGNVAGVGAGAIGDYGKGTSVTATRCLFVGNVAESSNSGAVNVEEEADLELIDCDFVENRNISPDAGWGGALVALQAANVSVSGCRFIENTATFSAGAVAFLNGAVAEFKNCEFIENSSGTNGGAARVSEDAMVTFANCLFAGNHANEFGGGVHSSLTTGEANIINATFSGNSAGTGGAMRVGSGGGVTISNSILWGDTPTEISAFQPQNVTVDHCDVQGGCEGAGNLNADPLFACDSFALSQKKAGQVKNSPCVDAGDGKAKKLGLKKYTTRCDSGRDKKSVDMGYHHPMP